MEGSKLSDEAQGIQQERFEPLTGQNEARRLLDKLEPGEPVFVFRGNDISAAIFVRAWIELQSLNPHVRPRKMRMARQIHLAMQQWKKKDWPT